MEREFDLFAPPEVAVVSKLDVILDVPLDVVEWYIKWRESQHSAELYIKEKK